jgi:hypothetical protein
MDSGARRQTERGLAGAQLDPPDVTGWLSPARVREMSSFSVGVILTTPSGHIHPGHVIGLNRDALTN